MRATSLAPIEPQRAASHSGDPGWSIALPPLGEPEAQNCLGVRVLIDRHVSDALDAEKLEQRRLVGAGRFDEVGKLVDLRRLDGRRGGRERAGVVVAACGEAEGGAQ